MRWSLEMFHVNQKTYTTLYFRFGVRYISSGKCVHIQIQTYTTLTHNGELYIQRLERQLDCVHIYIYKREKKHTLKRVRLVLARERKNL